VTVTTSATLLADAPGNPEDVTVRNADAAAAVSVGPSNVTTANGFEVPAGSAVSLTLNAGEALYGIGAASVVCHVLEVDVA
jgi:hypothetical protein